MTETKIQIVYSIDWEENKSSFGTFDDPTAGAEVWKRTKVTDWKDDKEVETFHKVAIFPSQKEAQKFIMSKVDGELN